MHRPEFVNVRQHHFDALGLGLEAAEAQQRIEPDQAAAGAVQPAQSSTVCEQLAKASSGSRARNARVTLVRRVPNRNTDTRLRASVMACRKCRNSLVYSLIEPEISSSATIGAGLSIRPRRWISIMSPPVRKEPRSVRRMSSRK